MYTDSLRIAWAGMTGNKLRSLLTMLGIIVGVAAVIALVSIGFGVQQKVKTSMTGLGSNLLMVMPGASTPAGGVRQAAGSNITLTRQDARAIGEGVPGVLRVAPSVSQQARLVRGNQNWKTSVQGSSTDIFALRNYELAAGTVFGNQEELLRSRVAVIGKTVAEALFGAANPVGQIIRIDAAPFTVIGVLNSKGQSSMGQDQDDIVLIPLTTAQERMLGISYLHSISVQLEDGADSDAAQEAIVQLLRTRHHLAAQAENDFSVRNMTALLEAMQENTATLTWFLGAIAAISLIVGGIGVMNIMLVSVTERTREIGVRKAIGATNRHILLQFLAEAVVISVGGGVIGIAVGIGGAYAVSTFSGWLTVVSYQAVAVSFGLTLAVGLFFGIYPARKAAALMPIDALRHE